MVPIRKLDPALVNKIAAGEVIERPASVVKELAENALDAGATRIDIALEEGGARLIRVTDNGSGIPGDQLLLAVASHATSKISAVDDLFNIHTLGFRGEALASIASVSQFRIVSRSADQLEAHELRLDTDPTASRTAIPASSTLNEMSHRPQPCAAPLGTTVEIRNLFFNVPARRKFLRQASAEVAHVTEQLARLALANPHVAFTYSHNGRELRNLPAADASSNSLAARRTRIGDFYGTELASCLLPVVRDERGLAIEALIAPPAQSRPSTKWQYIFLNGRYITDRRLAFAVREAFRGLVEHDRFPVVFLFLAAPPSHFDVNVHPTKIEVRWADSGLVQSQVLAALRETLLSQDLTPAFSLPGHAPFSSNAPSGRELHAGSPTQQRWGREDDRGLAPDRAQRTRQALADYLKSIDPTQARLNFAAPRFPTESLRHSIRTTFSPPNQEAPAADIIPANDPRLHQLETEGPAGATLRTADDDLCNAPFSSAQAAGVVQIHNTYLVAETDEGLIIIDQHALHERILYERFRERVLAGPLEAQRLLVPATLEASPAQTQAAEDHRELLARLGIEVSAYGKGSLAVQSFPTLLPDIDAARFVSDLLDKIAEPAHNREPNRFDLEAPPEGSAEELLIHRCLDMMACKAAVKAGDPLTADEMSALLAQRHLTQRSSNCPHGRPTTLELTTRDLEKQFKRI